jgi:CBS domain-containing protein
MTTNNIGRLPVIDQETGSLEGIITTADVFRAYDTYVSSMMDLSR